MNSKKSHILLIVTLVFCSIFIASCSDDIPVENIKNDTPPIQEENTQKPEQIVAPELEKEPTKQEERPRNLKIDAIAKQKILTRKWDFYAFKNDYKAALRAYELAWKLSKKRDTIVAKKIATLYFEKKLFANAKQYYQKTDIISLPTKDKIQYVQALQYTDTKNIKKELANLGLPDYLYAYYLLSETCISESIRCDEAIRSYRFDYEPGLRLQNALSTYSQLGMDDIIYRQALVASAFYKNGDYKALAHVGESILRTRPDYQAILKLTGYAHFEMRNFDRSLELLEKYKEKDAYDTQIDYIMGLIYAQKEDYVTSNLYLNNAVLGWFEPKDIAERKLAYNYYLLGLEKNMIQVLHHLLQSQNATEEDFTNAIYLALEFGDIRKAGMWLQRWIAQHPESAHILALSGWHQKLKGNITLAQQQLETSIDLDRKNVLGYLQLGIIAYDMWDFELAYDHLNKVSLLDPNGIFSIQVDEYIHKISSRDNFEYPTTTPTN